MKIIATTIFIIAFGAFVAWALPKALDRQTRVDCYKLQSQSTQYPNFYITSQENRDCKNVGVEVSATIKDNQ